MTGAEKQSLFAVILGVVALVLVFEMLRRRRLREKYAVLWLVIGLGALVVAIWPGLLDRLAAAVGITTPSNLLFFASLGISFFVALQLSSEVGTLEEESRTLAEEVGVLRMQVAELAARLAPPADPSAEPATTPDDAAARDAVPEPPRAAPASDQTSDQASGQASDPASDHAAAHRPPRP